MLQTQNDTHLEHIETMCIFALRNFYFIGFVIFVTYGSKA